MIVLRGKKTNNTSQNVDGKFEKGVNFNRVAREAF